MRRKRWELEKGIGRELKREFYSNKIHVKVDYTSEKTPNNDYFNDKIRKFENSNRLNL